MKLMNFTEFMGVMVFSSLVLPFLYYFGWVHYREGIRWDWQMKFRDECQMCFQGFSFLLFIIGIFHGFVYSVGGVILGVNYVCGLIPDCVVYTFWGFIIGTLILYIFYTMLFTSIFNTTVRDIMELPVDGSSDSLLSSVRPLSKQLRIAEGLVEQQGVINGLINATANYPEIQKGVEEKMKIVNGSWGYKYLTWLGSKMT